MSGAPWPGLTKDYNQARRAVWFATMAPRRKVQYVDDPALVGRRLRAAREAAGLSQRELSFPGCTAAYISRIESGDRTPSLQLLREFSRRTGVAESYLALGKSGSITVAGRLTEARVALRLSELDVARSAVDAAFGVAHTDAERADASAVAGAIALHAGDATQAIETLERARLLDPTIEERDAAVPEALGRAYARAFEYESAAAVFQRAGARARETGDLIGVVRFASLLANTYVDACNFTAAEDALASVISLSEEIEDPLTRAKMLWSQSRLHGHQNDNAAAARYAQRALEILEVSDQVYYAALAHQLLAHIELDRGNGERAAALLDRAAPMIASSGRRFEAASFRIEQARALLAAGRREEAAATALEASATMTELSSVDAGRSYALVADVFCELDEEERAIELLELAIEQLAATPNRYLVDAYRKLGELLERRGDAAAALDVYKRGMQVQVEAERSLLPPG